VLTGPFSIAGDLARIGPRDSWLVESAEFELQPVPEPVAVGLWVTSAAGLGLTRRRRRRSPERNPRVRGAMSP
jgi:hypothetical protein